MQCNYFLIAEGEDAADFNLREDVDFNRFNTLWWFEWPLEKIARQLGITPLTEFIRFSRAEMVYLMGEEGVLQTEQEGWVGDSEPVPWETEWFPAQEGLHTVRSLLEHIQSHPESLEEAQPGERHDTLVKELISALKSLEEDLVRAEQQKRKFRFYKQ